MTSQIRRLELIRNATTTLSRVALQQDQIGSAMDAMCKALKSDSAALLSLEVAQNGQVRAIAQHSRHQVRDRIHTSYIKDFFRGDPVLTGAVKRLRTYGWTVFRLGDPDAKVKSEAHERYVEEFLYPSGIRHIMALASIDPVIPNRINLVGCHRLSAASGYTYADLENAQVLAPATQACFQVRKPNDANVFGQAKPQNTSSPAIPCQVSSSHSGGRQFLSNFDLTERELDIVDRVLTGAKNREISEFLGISVKTVENHLSNIFSKTRSRSRQDLILMTLQGETPHPNPAEPVSPISNP